MIRPERPEDLDGILEVERLAFDSEEEARIVEVVRSQPGSFALVWEEGDQVVGHVQMSRAAVGETPVLALGPIAVHPDRQGKGIGSALIREALAEARLRGEIAVILLGSPDFYPRFGFEPASRYGLKNPYAGTTESGFVIAEEDFMLASLDDRAGALAGDVRWHPAFG